MPEELHLESMSNKILSRLSAADRALLTPSLTSIELPVRKMLEQRGKTIDHVYFIESGFASVVAYSGNRRRIEAGVVGREGVTGLAVIMGTDRSPHETFIQMPGRGLRMTANALRTAMNQSPTLRRALLHYAHAFFTQVSHTALANGCSNMEQRLARWLLMAHDRADGDDVQLTHEFLGIMLGVHRPRVTSTLAVLEKRGLLVANRGTVAIRDRAGLEKAAKGAYGVPESEFQRLFG